MNKLARSVDSSNAPEVWGGFQRADFLVKPDDGSLRQMRVMLFKIIPGCAASPRRLPVSNAAASRLKHLLNADAHFLFFDKFAPVGLVDPALYRGTEPGSFSSIRATFS